MLFDVISPIFFAVDLLHIRSPLDASLTRRLLHKKVVARIPKSLGSAHRG
ncbi:MAG: hypothetical protein ABI132_06000 [Rhodanobacteraceae bacterium]